MAESPSVRRLLRIRAGEEEQMKLALDAAMGELRRLQAALQEAQARERRGRKRIALSMQSGDPTDRIAAAVDRAAAQRAAGLLAQLVPESERKAARLRQDYLAKRVERRQVETMVQNAEAQARVERRRREQQGIDDWFGMGRRRRGSKWSEAESTGGRTVPARNEMKSPKESPDDPEVEREPFL